MAKLKGFSLNHKDVDTTQKEGGGALPDGFYRFEVDEATDKPHHDNRPGYKIDVVLEVIEPEEFKGRKIFVDFGVVDPEHSDDFEVWGREGLAKLLRAVDYDKEFEDPDDLIGLSGIAKVGLDRKRSDKQNKRYSKLWAYVYPEDEKEWLKDNELGESDRQEEWFPGKQTPATGRGERGGRDRGEREERGSRDRDRGSRERGGREDRDNDRSRGRDRDDSRGRGRDREERDERGNADDDIPFDGNREGGENEREERPRRGGGDNPWNKEGRGSRR